MVALASRALSKATSASNRFDIDLVEVSLVRIRNDVAFSILERWAPIVDVSEATWLMAESISSRASKALFTVVVSKVSSELSAAVPVAR